MNETITINLGGVVFHANEDAYEALNKYLDDIKKHFEEDTEQKDLIENVELRISEILLERRKEKSQAITLNDVYEVIEIIGQPEAFGKSKSKHKATSKKKISNKPYKRLYRNPDNAILGGICGGFGAYFRIDPIWFRLTFLLLFLLAGIGPLLYLILWFIIPKARTTAQKYEMRGEEMSLGNIKEEVKNEYRQARQNVNNNMRSSSAEQNDPKGVLGEIFDFITRILKGLVKAFLAITGLGLIVAGIAMIMVFIISIFFHELIISQVFTDASISFRDAFSAFFQGNDSTIIMVCLMIVVGLPLIAIFFAGLRFLFNRQPRRRAFNLFALVIWVISTVTLAFLLVLEGQNYIEHGKYKKQMEINELSSDVIYLDVNTDKLDHLKDNTHFIEYHDFGLYYSELGDRFYGKPTLNIEKGSDDEIEIVLEQQARGNTEKNAKNTAENILYYWTAKDSLLKLNPYFALPEDEKWRVHQMDITIKVPVGKSVYFSPDLVEILHPLKDHEHVSEHHIAGKEWVMKNNGLALVGKN